MSQAPPFSGLAPYVLGLAKPSAALPQHGEEVLCKAVESLKKFLHDEHTSHIKANTHLPLCCTYGSDCTPLLAKTTVRAQSGELTVSFRPRMPGE